MLWIRQHYYNSLNARQRDSSNLSYLICINVALLCASLAMLSGSMVILKASERNHRDAWNLLHTPCGFNNRSSSSYGY